MLQHLYSQSTSCHPASFLNSFTCSPDTSPWARYVRTWHLWFEFSVMLHSLYKSSMVPCTESIIKSCGNVQDLDLQNNIWCKGKLSNLMMHVWSKMMWHNHFVGLKAATSPYFILAIDTCMHVYHVSCSTSKYHSLRLRIHVYIYLDNINIIMQVHLDISWDAIKVRKRACTLQCHTQYNSHHKKCKMKPLLQLNEL